MGDIVLRNLVFSCLVKLNMAFRHWMLVTHMYIMFSFFGSCDGWWRIALTCILGEAQQIRGFFILNRDGWVWWMMQLLSYIMNAWWGCFTCCAIMLSNNCWRAAVFRIRITDSVFSRRGRRKSKLRPLLVAADPLAAAAVVVPPTLVACNWPTSLFWGEFTILVGASLPNSLPRTTNSVRTGSPLITLLRWNIALERCGCDIGATGFLSLPRIAECRLDSGKKSEFSRRKPRTKFSESFESLSWRLWLSNCCCWRPLAVLSMHIFLLTIWPLLGALLARKLFMNDWLACELFAKMSLFTRSSSLSLWLKVLTLSLSIVLGIFISIAFCRDDWSIDGSTEFRLALAGKNRSKSQSRRSTASSLSEVVVEEVAAELTVAIDVDEEVVESGDKCVELSTRYSVHHHRAKSK